jgi:hypothetical protein
LFAVTPVIFQSGYDCKNYTYLYCTNKKIHNVRLFYCIAIDLYRREKNKDRTRRH